MLDTLEIDGYRLDKETLQLALTEYNRFKKSDSYNERYKWKVLEKLNEWTDEHEITEDNVEDFFGLLEKENASEGSLASWRKINDLKNFVTDDPKLAAKSLRQLLGGDEPLHERIENFREIYNLQSQDCGYLFAAYDMENHAPFKVGAFESFLGLFCDLEESQIDLSNMSIGEKYALYHRVLKSIKKFLKEENDDNATALDAQDFIFCTTSYDKLMNNICIKYLFRFANKLKDIEDGIEKKGIDYLVDILQKYPDKLHEKNKEEWKDGEGPVQQVRYKLTDAIQNGKPIRLEEWKRQEKTNSNLDHLGKGNLDLKSSLNIEYKQYLEEGPLNEEFRNALEVDDYELSDEAVLSEEKENWWLIDDDIRFIIDLGSDDLKIYQVKETFRPWPKFKIVTQLFYNYYRERIKRYLNGLSEKLVDEIGREDLKYHKVDFQGPHNFPGTKSWLALYPISKTNHTLAYQLFIGIKSNSVEFGIKPGYDIDEGKEDLRIIEDEDELNISKIIDVFEEKKNEFYRLNEQPVEEFDSIEFQKDFKKFKKQLGQKSQVVFYGPPGTGKSYLANKFAKWWVKAQDEEANIEERIRTVTFHPSFSYEDFIEGLTARTDDNGDVEYKIEKGIFRDICDYALEAYKEAENRSEAQNYILIIDEINRGNIPKIFGETITLLEADKRLDGENYMTVELAHSGKKFSVPPNLKVIGTMNTADRSIALVDAALRRRFRFLHFPPDYELLYDHFEFEGKIDANDVIRNKGEDRKVLQALSILALETINQSIIDNLGKGKQIGHSYLLNQKDIDAIVDAWRYEIFPLLEEYYFGQFDRMKREVFAGNDSDLIDWDQEKINDFNDEQLKNTLTAIVDLEG